MKKALNIIAFIIAVSIGIWLAQVAVVLLSPPEPKTTAEPSYMGLTKEDYLNEVSNNGLDTGSLCVYTHLIDTYGIEETYKMDNRALKDANDVDSRIYEAIERCV